ncbi:MAG: permease [Halodesulfurarchaeum sp.]
MSQGLTGTIGTRLQGLYRRYVGEPENVRTMYAGFGLFFAGIALSVAGVVVFLSSVTVPQSGMFVWQLREIAITLTATGFPVFLFSFLVLLPVDRRAFLAAIAGGVICLGAVALFTYAYPYHWNVPGQDYSAMGVLTYAIGGVVLAASTGAALVTNYIQRSGPAPADIEGVERREDVGETSETTVTDEEVRRDIDEALSSSELSWGGVEKSDSKRLRFHVEEETNIDTSGMDRQVEETRAESVDHAVDGLRKLRGNEKRMATGQGTDEQASALKEVKQQAAAESEETEGYLDRLRSLIGG